MERRLAKNPPGNTEIEPSEQPTTLEEAKQSFEDDRRKDSTPEEREENKKMKPKEDQLPATQKNNVNKDLGNALCPTIAHRTIHKSPEKKKQYR